MESECVLDILCPMHALLDADGKIVHTGPTLTKMCRDTPVEGRRFLDLFEVLRPRSGQSAEDLRALAGRKLHLRMREAPRTEVKAVVAVLPTAKALPGVPDGGLVVNMSFGISVLDGVRDYALTSADFAATDLTVEMLYLIEAKSAAMEASRKLNLRLQGAMIAAEEQAFTDTLTGLKNRRAMDHVLDRLVRADMDFALMHLDLDFFKAVNDTMGHAAGDHVLQQVARILVDETRGDDTVARVGGDEFVLIFAKLKDKARLAQVATRIIEKLEQPIPFNNEICRISGSIGITLSHEYDPVDVAQMMEDADQALYASKHAGRAQASFATPGGGTSGGDAAARGLSRAG